MTKLRALLGAAALALAALGGFAIAQTTIIAQTFSGDEVIRASYSGPGSAEAWYSLSYIRNSTQIRTVSGSGAATLTASGGTTCWKSTAPTTWAVTLPAAPPAGTVVTLCSDTTLTTNVTVTAGSGDTLTTTYNSQTITANASFPAWQYHQSDKVWYRVQ